MACGCSCGGNKNPPTPGTHTRTPTHPQTGTHAFLSPYEMNWPMYNYSGDPSQLSAEWETLQNSLLFATSAVWFNDVDADINCFETTPLVSLNHICQLSGMARTQLVLKQSPHNTRYLPAQRMMATGSARCAPCVKDQHSKSAFFQQARARRQSGNGTTRSIVVGGKSLGFQRHHFFVLQRRLETDCKDSAERKQDRKLRLSRF